MYAKHGAFYFHHRSGRWERLGTDVEEAKRRAALIASGLNEGFGTVEFFIGAFLEHCRKRVAAGDLAPRTLADYTGDAEKLKAAFGALYPEAIDAPMVAEYLDFGLEQDRAVRANREKACLSAMMSWLVRTGQGNVKRNPCLGVRRNRETKRERYVEHDEMMATIGTAPVQIRGLALLVYRTLQRPEDIINWTARNIVERRTADGRTVRVIRNAQGKMNGRKLVDIEISDDIQRILDMLRSSSSKGNVTGLTLIHRRDGQPYTYSGLNTMLHRCQRALREKGGRFSDMLPWGFYDMKGKGATDMWLSGIQLEQIQLLCGHESVTTTERYVKSRWRGVVASNQVQIAV